MTEVAIIAPSMSSPRSYADAPRLPEGDLLEPAAILGDGNEPFELEIGPGHGGFIFERLALDPRVRIVGLEVRRKWAKIVDERLAARGLSARARVFAEDASVALPRLADLSVSRVFLHFPDPWWKTRHAKRRVLSEALLGQVVHVLVPGGDFFVQTDVPERADEYERLLSDAPGLVSGGPRPIENPFGAKSPRERRAEVDGLPIFRLLYRRSSP
jgi:tRNA (guanine-N7-)-methyltransferase